MASTVLVTGGSGFIVSRTILQLPPPPKPW
jgi:UDP-glucose 4-epimerase